MSEKLYRTQILLDSGQHKRLKALSLRTQRSISELVREAVAEYLTSEEVKKQASLEALEEIERLRQSLFQAWRGKPLEIDITELIREMREEHTDETLSKVNSD